MLDHIPIRYKLTLAFALILAITAVGGWFGVSAVTEVGRLVVTLYDKPLQSIDFSRSAQLHVRAMVMAQRVASLGEPHMAENARAEYRAARDEFDDDVAVARRRASSDALRQRLDEVSALIVQWDALIPPNVSTAMDNPAIHDLSRRILGTIDLAVENAKSDGFYFVENARAQAAETRQTTLVIVVAVVLVGLLVAALLTRNIVHPLNRAVRMAETIAGGHLSESVASLRRDESGKLLRAMEVMRAQLLLRVEADRRLVELERERRVNLGRYLDPKIGEWLADNSPETVRAGARQEVGILFTDIRGFTRRAESLDPTALGRFVGEFRACVAASATAHGGVIDKFIGDAAMLLFGVPHPRDGAAADALACAQDLLERVAAWNAERADRGEDAVRIGVGVHWGPVFCGAVGDDVRLEYTVLGDTVNVAARLQDETKTAGVPLIASKAALAAAGVLAGGLDGAGQPQGAGWRALPSKELRGRDGLMELFGWAPAAPESRSTAG